MAKTYEDEHALRLKEKREHEEYKKGIRKHWNAFLPCVGCTDNRGIWRYYKMPVDTLEAIEAMGVAVKEGD